MQYQFLRVTSQNPYIKEVTFCRESRGNALNHGLMKELLLVCTALAEDTDTRVVIFGGAGKHFCTGVDLMDPALMEQKQLGLLKQMRALELGPKVIEAVHTLPQITIAALRGKTLGGGACIATACDFRIAELDSEVGYPEANLGMNLSWLGLPLCVHLVGPSKAKRLVIMGKREAAADLFEWGFIDELVPLEQLDARVFAMAVEYAEQPPIAAQMIKRSINCLVSALDRSVMHMDQDQFILATNSKDFTEGVSAYVQKRKPQFTGE